MYVAISMACISIKWRKGFNTGHYCIGLQYGGNNYWRQNASSYILTVFLDAAMPNINSQRKGIKNLCGLAISVCKS